ncbi:MAG: aminotransferase class V-fold PLP-dependent enzyme [Gammaproteobacteria bacterium]|nr:aminotransferase class V-fold PLP-dependent enzyme [Gammaproteobacteria bacterium]MYF62191.1 aminotransferase class V-fold PLP-dependent enzyme [Gammaproteobacteria bacterium]MYI21474.1 aminotransferase class V-fold PLP-dependent enzyme [Gammaproteobacteria bacterium]
MKSEPGSETASLNLDDIRAQFPILHRRNYLNSCSLGALSIRAEEGLQAFLDRWHDMGASAWYEHWWELLAELRHRVAKLFAAPAGTVALMPSTSACLAVISESLDWTKRNRIVTTELDFPTLLYQWKVRPGVEMVVLESPDGVRVDPQQFEDAVDERTLAIATSHVFFTTGAILDMKSIAEIAHGAGAYCLIDGYQGAGQIPLDLPATGVDFYTAGPLKWLCGGPGLAYLYVREDLIPALEPRITSWFATEDQFRFNPGEFRYHADARRFELGTPALATVHTALGGQDIIDEVGAEAIRARNVTLTERLIEGCEAAGFAPRVAGQPDERSAIVPVRHPAPADAVQHLADRGIIVDSRPGVVRASPHFYNTVDEVDEFVDVLAEARPATRARRSPPTPAGRSAPRR